MPQTTSQRRAINRIVINAADKQARAEIDPKWAIPRLAMIISMMVIWIVANILTGFKERLADWMLTGTFPPEYYLPFSIYIASFIASCAVYAYFLNLLDHYVEGLINTRKNEILDELTKE